MASIVKKRVRCFYIKSKIKITVFLHFWFTLCTFKCLFAIQRRNLTLQRLGRGYIIPLEHMVYSSCRMQDSPCTVEEAI